MYFAKTPFFLTKLYPKRIWNKSRAKKTIYLTFDDGPNELATPFVLNCLDKFDAKATFFCIGKNVFNHSILYNKILEKGHTVGNHTYNHFNGFKTSNANYIKDIEATIKVIDSPFFRPPYGRCTSKQAKIINDILKLKIVMWDVLSGDFDTLITPQQCTNNVLKNAKNGSIIVFHDSVKAFKNLEVALPKTLEYFSSKGYSFKSL